MKTHRAYVVSLTVFCLSIILLLAISTAFYITHHSIVKSISNVVTLKKISCSLVLYIAAHLFRFLRLSILLNASGLRKLLALYFYTAACSLLFPFKLGELVRLNEISWWMNSLWRGLLIVWVERTLDVIFLIIILAILAPQLQDKIFFFKPLLIVIAAFLFLSLLIFFIIPEQLLGLNQYVIHNYKGKKAIRLLRTIDIFHRLLQELKPLIKGKLCTLTLLTSIIWIAEFFSIAILFMQDKLIGGLSSLIAQFSGTIYASQSMPNQIFSKLSDFNFFKVGLMVIFGLIALRFYIKWRSPYHREI